ncbi:hypothetical protein [Hyphococcus sp.]|uniref:hypothetical protein n=1 Tax=Hyphococcus sp. TaxID=2038636 RepID=UPI0035C73262
MEKKTQFTISQNGVPRRIFAIKETNKDELILLPTRNRGYHVSEPSSPSFSGPLELYDNNQLTIHTCDDSPVMNLINYKKQKKGAGPIKRIPTNALKLREEFFPAYYYATGNISPPLYDPNPKVENTICLGDFDPRLFTHCHAVFLSSQSKQFPDHSDRQYNVVSINIGNYRVHVVSFCLLLARETLKRGLKHIMAEYPNLNGYSNEDLAAMKVNSLNDDEVFGILSQHMFKTLEDFKPELSTAGKNILAELKHKPFPIASDKTRDFLEFLVQRRRAV